MEIIVQIFAHVGEEPCATFKVRKNELFLIMPHPRADLWKLPHHVEGEVKNARQMPRERIRGHGIDRACKITRRLKFHYKIKLQP